MDYTSEYREKMVFVDGKAAWGKISPDGAHIYVADPNAEGLEISVERSPDLRPGLQGKNRKARRAAIARRRRGGW